MKTIQLFEINSLFTLDDLNKTYKRLAIKYHPDMNQNKEEATEKFKKLQHEREYLENLYSKTGSFKERVENNNQSHEKTFTWNRSYQRTYDIYNSKTTNSNNTSYKKTSKTWPRYYKQATNTSFLNIEVSFFVHTIFAIIIGIMFALQWVYFIIASVLSVLYYNMSSNKLYLILTAISAYSFHAHILPYINMLL